MYQWTPIIEAQPSVQTAFAAHFRAVDETVKWERKCKAIKGELAFLVKAKAEIEAQGLTLETWPKETTIWERVAESKGYCQNYGVRWHVRNEHVTWGVKERYVSDILGPEGTEYRALLTKELEQAEQQQRQAKEAEDRALQALEAERAKYQWLVEKYQWLVDEQAEQQQRQAKEGL